MYNIIYLYYKNTQYSYEIRIYKYNTSEYEYNTNGYPNKIIDLYYIYVYQCKRYMIYIRLYMNSNF